MGGATFRAGRCPDLAQVNPSKNHPVPETPSGLGVCRIWRTNVKLETGEIAVYGVFMPQLHISDNFTLIDKQQCGFGIRLEFANQRVIDLRSIQIVEHVHGGGEEHTLIGLTGTPADDLCQKGLSFAVWIP